MTPRHPVPYLLLFTLLLTACAGTRETTREAAPEPQLLTEAQALLVIQETLARAGTRVEHTWPVRVNDAAEILVDARLGNDPFAIEWVSDQDRSEHPAILPSTRPDGPLRIVEGKSPDAPLAQVLVLDAHAYGYEGNPTLVQRGAPSLSDAEERVRRDVQEFMAYARTQDR
jgi:hypothetical protein